VDNNGKPKRATGIVEWEGTAVRVAMHTPYILLFDTHFIEIRHIETGHLVQIIPGNDVRCVWDGRIDGGTAVDYPEGQDLNMVQEPRIHAVMNVPELSTLPRRPGRYFIQHVFELFPTIPLYLPGSLASPSVNYFSRSFSPPRSPVLRPQHTYS
jgi:RHO1 GDP-GTP exchange protein 1/2